MSTEIVWIVETKEDGPIRVVAVDASAAKIRTVNRGYTVLNVRPADRSEVPKHITARGGADR